MLAAADGRAVEGSGDEDARAHRGTATGEGTEGGESGRLKWEQGGKEKEGGRSKARQKGGDWMM